MVRCMDQFCCFRERIVEGRVTEVTHELDPQEHIDCGVVRGEWVREGKGVYTQGEIQAVQTQREKDGESHSLPLWPNVTFRESMELLSQ